MSGKKTALVSEECVACGSCEKVCPLSAIRVHKGMYARVDHRCAGCGRCADACPAEVISIAPREAV